MNAWIIIVTTMFMTESVDGTLTPRSDWAPTTVTIKVKDKKACENGEDWLIGNTPIILPSKKTMAPGLTQVVTTKCVGTANYKPDEPYLPKSPK